MRYRVTRRAARIEVMASSLSTQGRIPPGAYWRSPARGRALILAAYLLAAAIAAIILFGCKRLHPTDTTPLDKAGMWYRSIEELRGLDVTDAEVAELVKAHDAGLSDGTCVELVRIARQRKQPVALGDAVANLRRVDVSESTLLELARLNQPGLWVGEAQAMRLAGLSDRVLLAVARRRAAGQPVLSGASIAQLKNAQLSEAEILDLIERGITDAQVEAMLAARQRAATGAGFVRYHRRRR